VALLEKRRFLYNHSGDFPQVILIVPSHVPNTGTILMAHRHMNVEIVAEAALFPEKELHKGDFPYSVEEDTLISIHPSGQSPCGGPVGVVGGSVLLHLQANPRLSSHGVWNQLNILQVKNSVDYR
jgi:hypothetical protein